MEGARVFGVLKAVGAVVVVLMAVAMSYAAWIVLRYWSGIGV
jgi:hypothetical protein